MICPNRLGQWSDQTHRLDPLVKQKTLLVCGVPIEEEKVLLGSGMLDEVERVVLSSIALARSWCSLDPFS